MSRQRRDIVKMVNEYLLRAIHLLQPNTHNEATIQISTEQLCLQSSCLESTHEKAYGISITIVCRGHIHEAIVIFHPPVPKALETIRKHQDFSQTYKPSLSRMMNLTRTGKV